VHAAEQSSSYRKLLRAAVPAELLSDERLEELLDPANYLGQSAEISRRILAAWPAYAQPEVAQPRREPTERNNPPEEKGAHRG
jgi:3-carboxy-cis,cis-muconate cycloisomerase